MRAELPASVTFELFVGERRIWPPSPGLSTDEPTDQAVLAAVESLAWSTDGGTPGEVT